MNQKALDETDSYFHTQNGEVHWYCIVFPHFFKIKSYTIKSRIINDHHPKEWKLTGSNDRVNWKLIDEQNTNVFNTIRKTVNFPVKYTGTYRYINMTQTFTTSNDNVIMTFGSIDFFGRIMLNAKGEANTCKHKHSMLLSVHSFIYLSFVAS